MTKASERLEATLQQKSVDSFRLLSTMRDIKTDDRQQNFALGKMMLAIASDVQQSNQNLSAKEEKALAEYMLDAFLRQGNLDKAIRSLEKDFRASPKDTQLQNRLAKLLQASGSPQHLERAATLWRSLETSVKPGTESWYDYRLSYAEILLAQGQQNQCRKLIAVTKALYPRIPNDSLKKRLAEISAKLK